MEITKMTKQVQENTSYGKDGVDEQYRFYPVRRATQGVCWQQVDNV